VARGPRVICDSASLAEGGAGVRFAWEVEEVPELPGFGPEQSLHVLRIFQEAVTNAIKHAKAKAVGISLANGSEEVILTIRNDGLPFPSLEGHSTGMGLRIMNYRASLIGASLDIRGDGPHGTCVACSVPLEGKR